MSLVVIDARSIDLQHDISGQGKFESIDIRHALVILHDHEIDSIKEFKQDAKRLISRPSIHLFITASPHLVSQDHPFLTSPHARMSMKRARIMGDPNFSVCDPAGHGQW